ncbi:MAG: protein kinase [Pirellulales bacterium]
MSEESQILGNECLAGDPAAPQKVFERYIRRLTALARKRLAPAVGRRVDPEDAVQSAFRSFFLGARSGKFVLDDADGLWRLLATITARKAARLNERHAAARRNVRREHLAGGTDSSIGVDDRFIARDAMPEAAAVLADEVSAVMGRLEPELRVALEMRLQDVSVEEIAATLKKSPRTIRRYLEQVRQVIAPASESPAACRSAGESIVASRQACSDAESAASSSVVDYRDLVLQSHLGSGGVGKVYRTWRRTDGATFALKVLKKKLAHHPAAVRRFVAEYEMMAGWNHPGIVPVRGLGRTPAGTVFYLMDLLPGRSLAEVSPAEYDASRVRRWLRQIVAGVEYAHRHGVVHCDLKPGNVLLNSAGDAVIVDFGFAQYLNETGFATGATPAFAAPELLEPALGAISPAVDVWGIGAILHWLLYHRPPHGEAIGDDALQPSPLQVLCVRCLADVPAARPNLSEVIAALEAD